jgi:mannose/fructose/N-acetylgalactosamine-specific phosphotransferase system component IIC
MTAWLAAAAAALVELDAASFGQLMVSRPIVLGPALGALLGDAALGAALGIICELFNLADAPVGGRLRLNPTVAVAAALLLALGPAVVAVEAALPAGLAVGLMHARLECRLRLWRAAVSAEATRRLEQGRDPRLMRLALSQLGLQAAATFAVLAGVLVVGQPLSSVFGALPDAARSGLRLGLIAAPFLALACLLHSFKVVS